MTNEERMKIVLNLFEDCCVTLNKKGKDYTTKNNKGEEDINGNFQTIVDTFFDPALGITKYHIWAIFFFKHLSSLQNFIKSGKLESESIRSRILDLINYLVILESMLENDGFITLAECKPNLGKDLHQMIHQFMEIKGS